MKPLFDCIYSFDAQQCAQLGMRPLNQFFPLGFDEVRQGLGSPPAGGRAKKCFFLGRDKGRAAMLCALAQNLKANHCEADFHIVQDATTTLPSPYHVSQGMDYEQNLKRAQQAEVLVEINQPGQVGATLRALEAAYFGKKLITNNPAVKELELYHPANVFVLESQGASNVNQLESFLKCPLQALPEGVLYRYSPDFMLEQLMADAEAQRSAERSAR
ncbi:hypothetical protein [Pseudomonas sp. RIT-PI-S]|uniref:hypothetical protein n=1 Tax=Pseudomonas sp. RIT-PI-S TaxID=3035295 RepID=UPI0021DB600D|nr:hypothetical protein [Pseudomonas sp. RIT-PI-S]